MEGDYTPMVSYIMNTFFPPLLVIIVAEAVLERLNAERSECAHARHCPIRIDYNIYDGRNIIAPNAQTAVQNIRETEEKDTPQ